MLVLNPNRRDRIFAEDTLLSALFNFARGEGMTSAPNPCAGVKGTKAKRDVYIYDATFAAVWEAADVMTRDAMDLALLTGQRPKDTTAFRETDIRSLVQWGLSLSEERDSNGV
jgi:hypothetical protein